MNGLYVGGNVDLCVKVPTARLEIEGTSSKGILLKLTNGNIRVIDDWDTGDNSPGILAEGEIAPRRHGG